MRNVNEVVYEGFMGTRGQEQTKRRRPPTRLAQQKKKKREEVTSVQSSLKIATQQLHRSQKSAFPLFGGNK